MSVHSAASAGGLANGLGWEWCVAAILMDLSKTFDCLPHELMVAKLKAYGLSDKVVSLFLNGRMQQVRVGSHTSSWKKCLRVFHRDLF